MSVSESVPDPVRELWLQAIEHAGVIEDIPHLLPAVGNPLADPRPAVHLKPGMRLKFVPWREMFNQPTLAEANDLTILRRHRIGLRCNFPFTDPFSKSVALGLLRHEIEHAMQYSRSGDSLYDLDHLAHLVADAKDGPDGNTLYRLMPTEQGASAAAAQLVLATATPAVVEQLGDSNFSPFVSSQPTVPIGDIQYLTVQFIFEHGAHLDPRGLLSSEDAWEELVESACPGAGAWWHQLATRDA